MNFFIREIDGQIEIETVYSEGSNAAGVLYSFIDQKDVSEISSNDSMSLVFALDRNTSRHNISLPLDPGRYKIFAYDIEQNGTISNRVNYPAVTRDFNLHNEINPGT